MKILWLSYWLCLRLTVTLGLQCAARPEAFLGNLAHEHVSLISPGRYVHPFRGVLSPLPRVRRNLFTVSRNDRSAGLSELLGGTDENGLTSEDRSTPLFKQLLAETIGTFLIVQIGTGSVMSAVFADSLVGLFQVASVWIIAVTIAICTTAGISGAHLNPAISIAFATIRPSDSFSWRKVAPYTLAQIFGAILGSLTNLVLYGNLISAFESTNGIVRSSAAGIASAKAFGEYFINPVSTAIAFLAETIGTAILSFVIFSLTNERNDAVKNSFIPPLIGLTVGALIAVLAPLTQAGFNPARDFGPRLVAWCAGWKSVAFTGAWVYVVGPILGALIGATVADKVLFC